MLTSVLAHARDAAICADADPEPPARDGNVYRFGANVATRPIASRPSRYRRNAYAARFVALAVTALMHALIGAAFFIEWRSPVKAIAADDPIVVTLLPLAPDAPAHTPKTVAARTPPVRRATDRSLPIVESPREAEVRAREPFADTPAPADDGKKDQVAQISQAYRRAILGRLEAVRAYPRGALLDGYQGTGALSFRIDRQGHLLDVSIAASTGHESLDQAALALVRNAAPFPAMPIGFPDELSLTLPIEFLIMTSGGGRKAG